MRKCQGYEFNSQVPQPPRQPRFYSSPSSVEIPSSVPIRDSDKWRESRSRGVEENEEEEIRI